MFNENTYKPMVCPICGEFYFTELIEETDEDLGYFSRLVEKTVDVEPIPYCHHCGWNYDLDQVENPDKKNGENELSLNEYKQWYEKKISENPDYDYLDEHIPQPKPHKCPVCGKYEFEDEWSFDICPYCGWEDDGLCEEEPEFEGGANTLSLIEFKKRYERFVAEKPDYKWDNDLGKH